MDGFRKVKKKKVRRPKKKATLSKVKKKIPRTRAVQRTEITFLEGHNDLNRRVLPTNGDVMKYFIYLQNSSKDQFLEKSPIAEKVAEKVQSIYDRASIPCFNLKSIQRKILKDVEYYLKLKRRVKEPGVKYEKDCKTFIENSGKLLKVIFSKCRNFIPCNCPIDKKIPSREIEFLIDQRTERKLVIEYACDKVVTEQLKRKYRKLKSCDVFKLK